MSRVVLAYPYEPAPQRWRGPSDGILTIGPDPAWWPGAIRGLDPVEAEPAALQEELARYVRPGDLVIPMVEESVLVAATVARNAGATSVPWSAALRCTDRQSQRRALDPLAMNPRWAADRIPELVDPPWVVKAAASSESEGVRVAITEDELELCSWAAQKGGARHRARLTHCLGRPLDYAVLVEEYLAGQHYEASGINGPASTYPLYSYHPVHQSWSPDGRRIVCYSAVEDPRTAGDLRAVAVAAVRRLGVAWAAWNVEIMGPPWRVVEVHARPGWDVGKGYFGAMRAPRAPIMHAAEVLAYTWRTWQRKSPGSQ